MMRGWFAVIWAAVASFAVIGCTALLSADGDYHLATTGSGGGTSHASSSGAGGSDGSGGASTSTGTGGAPGTGVVGTLGGSCPAVGVLGCAGNAQKSKLICGADMKWSTNGTCDGTDMLCNSQEGPEQGTCGQVTALCVGQAPAAIVCLDTWHRVMCGPDLLTTEDLDTCMHQTCVGGECVGVCGPGDSQCDGKVLQDCGPNGQWVSSTSCTGATPTSCYCSFGSCVCP